jgi:GNAT superfamily N-acetyltransferase
MSETTATPTIRAATENDVPLIFDLICELATYEKLRDQVVGTPEILRDTLFEQRAAEALVVESAGDPIGYALFYTTFSSFECRAGIWLEDVYVKPEHRRGGVGRQVLEHLAGIAEQRGSVRLEWVALDWNEPALNFYKKLGAATLDDWLIHRLEGDGIRKLAAGE